MAIIGHVDLDAFFASVEERDKPYLKGLPVVVGADPEGGKGRGVVATANYAARAYGIHSAMPITRAWRLSEKARSEGRPAAAFLSSGLGKYSDESEKIFDIVGKRIPVIQKTSIDEAYLDLSFTRSYKQARNLAMVIKREVSAKRKITASFGIGPNKMIAKIASDIGKPDGLHVVTPGRVAKFLAPLSVRKIPGVGQKSAAQLARKGVHTVSDLQKLSWEVLSSEFGAHGFDLYEKAQGIAPSILTGAREQKSVGAHETLRRDIQSLALADTVMRRLADDIARRLKKSGVTGFRTVVLTVRFSDFETKDRSLTSKELLTTQESLEMRALKLLIPFFERSENPHGKAVRMLGLRVEKLEKNVRKEA